MGRPRAQLPHVGGACLAAAASSVSQTRNTHTVRPRASWPRPSTRGCPAAGCERTDDDRRGDPWK
eukprot:1248985-Alexandrium_andersonii.AAC.1